MQDKPNCARASPRHHIERRISPPAATWKSYRGVFRRLESTANPLAITPTGAMRVLERLLAAAVARPKRDATPRRIMFGLRDVSPVSSSGNDDFVSGTPTINRHRTETCASHLSSTRGEESAAVRNQACRPRQHNPQLVLVGLMAWRAHLPPRKKRRIIICTVAPGCAEMISSRTLDRKK